MSNPELTVAQIRILLQRSAVLCDAILSREGIPQEIVEAAQKLVEDLDQATIALGRQDPRGVTT